MPESQANRDNWAAVLAAMEAGLAEANDTTIWDDEEAAPAVVWVIPESIGPLPPSMREQAARILEAQDHTIAHLAEHRDVVGRHLAAVRSVPSAVQGGRSAYLDVTG